MSHSTKDRSFIEDAEWIASYQKNNDKKAFGRLFEKYLPLVFGLCLKYFKDEAKAEDAVMDIFEKIAIKLKEQKIEFFRSWLYTVSKNHCFEQIRKKAVLKEKETDFQIMYSGSYFHPDDVRDKEAVMLILEKCLKGLPENQRKCIDLFYLQSKSYKYITKIFNMNWPQVRSHIQNGRRNLKNCLMKHETER